MKDNVRQGPFQTQILECRIKPVFGVMVTPLRVGVAQPGGMQPLAPGLHVLHMYTRLKMSSSKVSVVHDVFALDGNELSSTSMVEHEIWITNSEPFKEHFR